MANSNTSGESIASRIEFRPVPDGQKQYVSNQARAEIIRDLIVAFEKLEEGDVIFSPEAPTDKSKAWWPTDPVTGIPIGQPKRWDEEENNWVDIADPGTSQYEPPVERVKTEEIEEGSSLVTYEFEDMGTDQYRVSLTPYFKVDGVWVTPAASMNNFAFAIAGKTNTTLQVQFYGVPSTGLMVEAWLRAPEETN